MTNKHGELNNITIHLQPNEWGLVQKILASEAQSIDKYDTEDAQKRKNKLIELIDRINKAIAIQL
jgi:hypothetical protein